MNPLMKISMPLALCSILALGACATQDQAGPAGSAVTGAAAAHAAGTPGAPWAGNTAGMAEQYSRPRLGPTPAAGASAWVPAAPAPAYVDTSPAPPANPPAPPPAAVANRQPSTPAPSAPVAASAIVRPEAAAPAAQPAPTPAPQTASASQVDAARGRQLFNDWSCGACHRLGDANASGSIGPSLDNNPRLTREIASDVIRNGRGAMPAFGGQIPDPDIELLASYIVQVARK